MKRYEEMTPEEKEIFVDGANYSRAYIAHCWTNFPWELNLFGIKKFMEGLKTFVNGGNYIPNNEELTFKEFVNKYKHHY